MKKQPNLPVAISSGSPNDIPEPLKWFADVLVEKGNGPEALREAVEKLIAISSKTKNVPSREADRQSQVLSA